MSYPLEMLPTKPEDLSGIDSREALPYQMSFMKNTLLRGFNTIHSVATLINCSHPSFPAFVEYVGAFCALLRLHYDGDEHFFTTHSPQGKSFSGDFWGVYTNPLKGPFSRLLDDLEKVLESVREMPSSYQATVMLDKLSWGVDLREQMNSQVTSFDVKKILIEFTDAELKAMVEENVQWVASQSDIGFLLPYIVSHHDPSTSLFWPTISDEGKAALPWLIETHAGCWQFAPFDPLTRDAKIWSP